MDFKNKKVVNIFPGRYINWDCPKPTKNKVTPAQIKIIIPAIIYYAIQNCCAAQCWGPPVTYHLMFQQAPVTKHSTWMCPMMTCKLIDSNWLYVKQTSEELTLSTLFSKQYRGRCHYYPILQMTKQRLNYLLRTVVELGYEPRQHGTSVYTICASLLISFLQCIFFSNQYSDLRK